MKVITTNLTTSGNSVAVRLPQELLKMSGLGQQVTLEAKRGKIIISQPVNPRVGWAQQIDAQLASAAAGSAENDPTYEFTDMSAAAQDGLDSLPWDGPSYEDWQKS